MKQQSVILLGAGGHAKVVLDLLHLLQHSVLGVTDPLLKRQGIREWRGLEVLGDDQAITIHSPDQVVLANGIGSLPGQHQRKTLYDNWTMHGYTFITLVHPSVLLGEGVQLTSGVQIMAGAVIQADTRIDENTLINTGVCVDHDCKIGKHCHLAPGAVLSGNVTVSNECHIGPASCVVQGCHLGKGAILGAGTTLLNHLPANNKQLAAKPQPPFSMTK